MVLFSALPAGWVPAGLGIWIESQDIGSLSGRGWGGGALPRLGGVLALLPSWQELESWSWSLLALGPEHF